MNSSKWLWNYLEQAPLPSLITVEERQHFVPLPSVDWCKD